MVWSLDLLTWVQHLRHHPEKLMYITGCARECWRVMDFSWIPPWTITLNTLKWYDKKKQNSSIFFFSLSSLGQTIMITWGVVLMILIFVDSILSDFSVGLATPPVISIRHSLGGGIANLLGPDGQGTDVEVLYQTKNMFMIFSYTKRLCFRKKC